MNQNRRNNQNRWQNRPRNRQNRPDHQTDRNRQTPRSNDLSTTNDQTRASQQTNASWSEASSSTTPGVSEQWHQNPYSRTYTPQPQRLQQVNYPGPGSQQHFHNQAQNHPPHYAPVASNLAPYIPNSLDMEANDLYSDVHCSISRAIDSSYAMPISEHIYYSSFESYDNIMIQQRNQLDAMMSQLSQCVGSQGTYNYANPNVAPLAATNILSSQIDFSSMSDMQDKYESVNEISEQIFDRIGQNLDDAAGLRMRDAQLVQATLDAAKQNKLPTSHFNTPAHPVHYQHQLVQQNNLSSSSSSSSLTNRPSETSSPASSIIQQQHNVNEVDYQSQNFGRIPTYGPRIGDNRNTRNVHSQFNVIQPVTMQNQQKTHYGGYLGKQHYGSPYHQRFSSRENKNIPRPQDSFKDEIDNSYQPFKPLIKEKPNALVPLNITVSKLDDHGDEFYLHPYEHEINYFRIGEEFLKRREPIKPTDINTSPIILIETLEQLQEMCQIIEQQKEIAVDVEHHSYRSYQGITCLLQISTREQDFVIDAIKLRGELYRLNNSFTNPSIVKVFHGADCDILWLQRDFGVYVVNLFDTSRAAKVLKFAHLSLAFLMKHYCNSEVDKSYQLADWRERPLPLPMLQYARTDTHYLLYIFDRVRNDLLDRDKQNKDVGIELLRNVHNRCNDICLKRYEKPPYSDKSHLSVLRKSKSTFNAKQMYAFKELYKWRDKISRKLDESVGYVLPNNLMIRIAEYLPREPQGITALCNPVPPTLKKYLSDVHAIILKAIDIPLDEASKVMTGRSPLEIDPSLRSIDLDSSNHKQDIAHAAGLQDGEVRGILDMFYQLNCGDSAGEQPPHDGHSRNYPYYVNNQTLHDYTNSLNQDPSPLYNFLGQAQSDLHREEFRNIHQTIQKQFVSPYSRYEARNK